MVEIMIRIQIQSTRAWLTHGLTKVHEVSEQQNVTRAVHAWLSVSKGTTNRNLPARNTAVYTDPRHNHDAKYSVLAAKFFSNSAGSEYINNLRVTVWKPSCLTWSALQTQTTRRHDYANAISRSAKKHYEVMNSWQLANCKRFCHSKLCLQFRMYVFHWFLNGLWNGYYVAEAGVSDYYRYSHFSQSQSQYWRASCN